MIRWWHKFHNLCGYVTSKSMYCWKKKMKSNISFLSDISILLLKLDKSFFKKTQILFGLVIINIQTYQGSGQTLPS